MYRLVCMLLLLSSVIEAKPLIDDDSARVYIEKYKHIAIMEMDRGGVPASIKMAQALLESNAGQGELAKNANNHFGIKCGSSWDGKTLALKDDDKDKNGKDVSHIVDKRTGEECLTGDRGQNALPANTVPRILDQVSQRGLSFERVVVQVDLFKPQRDDFHRLCLERVLF